MEKCVGKRLWILFKEEKEIVGVLRGFDDFFSNLIQ